MKKIIAKIILTALVITVVGGLALPLVAADTPSLADVHSSNEIVAGDDSLTMSPPTPPPIPVPEPPQPPQY